MPIDQRLEEMLLMQEDLALAGLEVARFISEESMNIFGVGDGKFKSDGSTWIILPGFAAPTVAYLGIKFGLKRQGCNAVIYPPKYVVNIEPIDQTVEGYVDFVLKLKEQIGDDKRLFVWGHSKGGLMHLAASVKFPKEIQAAVCHPIYVGAPFPSWVNSSMGSWYLSWLNFFDGDDFTLTRLRDELGDLTSIDATSFGNPEDRVIQGEFIGHHIAVSGSHSGLPWNRQVLRKIPEILSEKAA